MAKEVTLQQLSEWVAKNENRTWSRSDLVDYTKRTLEMKYIRFNLDTRDMMIFRVDTDSDRGVSADFREEFDGNILELLESKLDAYKKKVRG